MKKSRYVAEYGILITLALILSYVEARIPISFVIPGIKLGLTNVLVLVVLYMNDWKRAIGVNVLRIILVGFLFGNGISIIYSLAGGLLSGGIMILMKYTGKFNIVSVSICGGIFHNIGQIIVAIIFLQTKMIAWYLFVLWFGGIVSGTVIGVIGSELVKRLGGIRFENQY